MSGYAIFYRKKTFNLSELETYWREVRATAEGFDMQVLVNHGQHKEVEGEIYEGVVVTKFPLYEKALEWYKSESYQKVAQHRFKGALYQVVLVEGLK